LLKEVIKAKNSSRLWPSFGLLLSKKATHKLMLTTEAAFGLLKSTHQMLMENHLNTCFKKALGQKNENCKKEYVLKETQPKGGRNCSCCH